MALDDCPLLVKAMVFAGGVKVIYQEGDVFDVNIEGAAGVRVRQSVGRAGLDQGRRVSAAGRAVSAAGGPTRGTYYGHKRKTEGGGVQGVAPGSAKRLPRRRGRVGRKDPSGLDRFDRQGDRGCPGRAEEAAREHEALKGSADEKKSLIEEKIKVLTDDK
ncbi:MAG: hypothetical protein M9938_09950 [Solirubrobacterales bacterium]|nr:hypothetical protein [Solirubrobacterales bacterium]